MDLLIDNTMTLLNGIGPVFCDHIWRVFIQSSILIGVLLVLDRLLRGRVRAVVRYGLWMLVFVKLLLPPALALPTGIGYYRPHRMPLRHEMPEPVVTEMPHVPAPAVTGKQLARAVPQTAEVVPLHDAGTVTHEPVPAPDRSIVVRPILTWQAWVSVVWLVGVAVLCLCLVRRFRYVGRLVRASTPASKSLQDIATECTAVLGLRRCPQVCLSPDVPGPVVCRLWRPVVLMPATFPSRVCEDRLRTVLVHELAHIKRGDLWVNFVQTLLLAAYFYHPLLWLVNAIVRRLREQAVDEMVLVALDAEAAGYSTTLIDLAEMTFTKPILGLRLIGIAESRKALEGRIRHMMTRPKPRTARVGAWGLLAIALVAALLLPMAQARIGAVPSSGQQCEGELVFNETLPVDLNAGVTEHPGLVRIESVRFETAYGNAWKVIARLGWLPSRDATWRLKAELLDDQGRVLRHPLDRALVFTGIAASDTPTGMCFVDLLLPPMQFEKRRHATRFRLYLEPYSESPNGEGRTMDITVVKPGGKSPNSGAVLVVDSYRELASMEPRRALYITDSRGRCTVKLGADTVCSPLTIYVQKEGFASMAKVWSNRGPSLASRGALVSLPQRHVFEMIPGTVVGGTVRDINGAPIEGAEVGISAHRDELSGRYSFTRKVRSDANGRWRFEGIPQDIERVSLRLRHPEFGGDYAYSRVLTDEALLRARALHRIDTLERGVRLSGTVLDEDGKPVSDAAVMLVQRGDARSQAISGPAGQFSLVCSIERHSLNDAPVILVEAPGYAPACEPIDIRPEHAPLEFRLQRGRTVTCRVVDRAGEPLAGAWAAVDLLADYEDYGVWLEETDERGVFTIPNAPDDEIRLTIGKSGFITKRSYVVASSQSKVTIPMQDALDVRGTVTDAATGRPIPHFEIATVYSLANRPGSRDLRAFVDGRYELTFEEALSRPLYLRVSAVGYKAAVSEGLTLGSGNRVLDFQLVRGEDFDEAMAGRPPRQREEPGVRRIAGVVRDARGAPVGGATVSPVPWLGTDVVTDSDGAFAFKTRPDSGMGVFPWQEARWLLVRQAEQNLAAAVQLDETVNTLDITLANGMILSGRVVDIDGEAVPGAELSLTFWASNKGYGSREPAEIDAQGRFEIRAVPRGHRYSVRARADGYGEPSVEVQKGRTVRERIELESLVLQVANLRVSGVVVDELDRPVANVRVSGYGDGQPHRETYADTRGRFTLENMCDGAVALHANPGGSKRMYGEARAVAGATDVRIVLREF